MDKKLLWLKNRRVIPALVALLMTVSLAPVLSGCSNTNDTMEETSSSAQETVEQSATTTEAVETTKTVEHSIDENPVPLTDADLVLTTEGYGAIGALADKDLSINDMLTYAVQDEYLARGEYLAIIEKFGNQNPYVNIVKAEQTHLDYLAEVYGSYGLEFPTDTSVGHIVVPADLLEAAQTGVQAEIDNIAMYERFLAYDLPENVFDVFSALKSGSDSHLLAFQKQVDKLS